MSCSSSCFPLAGVWPVSCPFAVRLLAIMLLGNEICANIVDIKVVRGWIYICNVSDCRACYS